MYNNIPKELKQDALFCLWKYETRKGQKTKVPYKTNGNWACVNSATDFSSFDSVSKLVDKYSGIGMGVFNGYSAIDIDHCVEDGVPNEMATDIINTMKAYTELSPSGTGVRIIFKVDNYNFDKNAYYIHNAKIGLALFVGIPLPGTGAWTGALIASLLDIPFKKAFPAILLGILIATVIMSLISYGLLGALMGAFA